MLVKELGAEISPANAVRSSASFLFFGNQFFRLRRASPARQRPPLLHLGRGRTETVANVLLVHLDCPGRKSDKKVKGVKKACRRETIVNELTRPPPRGATAWTKTASGRGRPWRGGGPDEVLPILGHFPRTFKNNWRRRKSETCPQGHNVY